VLIAAAFRLAARERSEPGSIRTEILQRNMMMDTPMNVCVLVGSLRKASFNRMLANVLI
jgi:hypothetical protein